jgi:hypothetical protein
MNRFCAAATPAIQWLFWVAQTDGWWLMFLELCDTFRCICVFILDIFMSTGVSDRHFLIIQFQPDINLFAMHHQMAEWLIKVKIAMNPPHILPASSPQN